MVKGIHKVTKAVRAVKIIPKAKVKNHERFATEINILRGLVRYYDSRTILTSSNSMRPLRTPAMFTLSLKYAKEESFSTELSTRCVFV